MLVPLFGANRKSELFGMFGKRALAIKETKKGIQVEKNQEKNGRLSRNSGLVGKWEILGLTQGSTLSHL